MVSRVLDVLQRLPAAETGAGVVVLLARVVSDMTGGSLLAEHDRSSGIDMHKVCGRYDIALEKLQKNANRRAKRQKVDAVQSWMWWTSAI